MLHLKQTNIRLADKCSSWPDLKNQSSRKIIMAMSLHRGAVFGRRLLASTPSNPLATSVPFIPSGTRRLKSTGTPVNMGVMFVPQQEAWLVERMGKFNTILEPGLNFLIPILDKVLLQKVGSSSLDIFQLKQILTT